MGPSPISHLAAGDSSEDDEEVSDSWVPPPPKKWSLKQHPKGFVIFDDFLGGNVALGGLPAFHDKKGAQQVKVLQAMTCKHCHHLLPVPERHWQHI